MIRFSLMSACIVAAVSLAAAGCKSDSTSPGDRTTAAASTPEVWEPIDPTFKGCEAG